MDIALIVQSFAAKFPFIFGIFAVMGIARAIFKPLFVFLHSIVEVTPGSKDDELLTKVEGSKILKGIAFALDYLASIKLIK